MPVDTAHPQYLEWREDWKKIRDVLGGERAIKAATTEYLPKLDGQELDEYAAYLARGVFFDATSRTQDGLLGAIFRKPPDIEAPDRSEDLLANIDGAGSPFETFAKQVTGEVIATGRYGVMADVPDGENQPFLASYPAESIISWHEDVTGGKRQLRMVVLKETRQEPKASDPFELEDQISYRVLALGPTIKENSGVPEGQYSVTVFHKVVTGTSGDSFHADEPLIPKRSGKALDFIPFQFFGPRMLSPAVQKPPLLGLADANLGHWRTTVELRHGAHYTALPTLVVAGADIGPEFDMTIGPATGIKLPEAGAASFLEYKGDGLGSLERMIDKGEKQMAVLGARLLEEPKAAAESGVAMGLRHRGEHSMLASISDTVGRGLERTFNWAVWWAGGEEDKARVALNKDFFEAQLSPEDVVKLVSAWQSGGIGGETVHWNLAQGERLPPDMDFEAWQKDLEENGPAAAFMGAEPGDDELDDEDEDEDES